MNSGNTIEVRNVRKSYKVYLDKGYELKERMLFRKRNIYEKREVLKGISFDVKRGEAVGLIGKNGCGKSTTLKLLNRILYPDSGTVSVQGRVSSLIELGAGFHPDMSGRDNIYTNAAIFGLNKKEIDKRLDKIIRFSELEKYIDNPVRTYSSGMYMRLAFSVAINVDADVLLIDEILGVGDINFQTKCFNKLMEIKERGTTIVIVSHSLEQVEAICDRSIWIEEGQIRESGRPQIIHERYRESMEEKRQERIQVEAEQKVVVEEPIVLPEFCAACARRYGNYKMEFSEIHLENKVGEETLEFDREDNIFIYYKVNTKGLNEKINIAYRITRDDGVTCFASDYTTYNYIYTGDVNFLEAKNNGEGKLCIETQHVLLEGVYYLDLIVSREGIEVYDEICRVKEFYIKGASPGFGVCEIKTTWFMDEEKFETNK